jgi:hypothetical protein
VIEMSDSEEMEKMKIINLEKRKQALADYLKINPNEITACSKHINTLSTFQARKTIYLVVTEEEVDAGLRGYFEHNLADLNTTFIGQTAKLSPGDAQVVNRLCELLDEDIEMDILNEALLSVVRKCGDLNSLIDAAMADVDRGRFLDMNGEENPFGDYFIYKFREGQCSDLDHQA